MTDNARIEEIRKSNTESLKQDNVFFKTILLEEKELLSHINTLQAELDKLRNDTQSTWRDELNKAIEPFQKQLGIVVGQRDRFIKAIDNEENIDRHGHQLAYLETLNDKIKQEIQQEDGK